jgi:hypothetical protein
MQSVNEVTPDVRFVIFAHHGNFRRVLSWKWNGFRNYCFICNWRIPVTIIYLFVSGEW